MPLMRECNEYRSIIIVIKFGNSERMAIQSLWVSYGMEASYLRYSVVWTVGYGMIVQQKMHRFKGRYTSTIIRL